MEYKRVNSDVNGNPRYVIHFLDILSPAEQTAVRAKSQPNQTIEDQYQAAVIKARKIGGRKYTGKDFGGATISLK